MQAAGGAGAGYLLDSNVLIDAHRRYYAFDICPGFWACLLHHCASARILSIDKVFDEITGNDPLGQWVRAAPVSFFRDSSDPAVQAAYAQVMQWVTSGSFTPSALAEFASTADSWIVAHGMATGMTVVTEETYEPNRINRVKIPNACKAFNVNFINSFDMLRAVQAKFTF